MTADTTPSIQHAHFEFGLEAVSRHFVWNFLHSYPFYNSEQSSQRYVRLHEIKAYVPPLEPEARRIYVAAIEKGLALLSRARRAS